MYYLEERKRFREKDEEGTNSSKKTKILTDSEVMRVKGTACTNYIELYMYIKQHYTKDKDITSYAYMYTCSTMGILLQTIMISKFIVYMYTHSYVFTCI